LAALVRMALPLCKQAERDHPRTGPGRKPDHPDWLLAVLIMVTVLKRKKTKSAQFRFISEHKRDLKQMLGARALSNQHEKHARVAFSAGGHSWCSRRSPMVARTRTQKCRMS